MDIVTDIALLVAKVIGGAVYAFGFATVWLMAGIHGRGIFNHEYGWLYGVRTFLICLVWPVSVTVFYLQSEYEAHQCQKKWKQDQLDKKSKV